MNAPIVPGARPLYRSVFVSDTHLGTRGARCDFLADFLRRTSCQKLFLVGDIFDGWRLRKSWYWDEHHDEVLRQILRHARGGTEVTYIPGNHDEMFRAWLPIRGLEIAGIRLRQEAEHVTADGRRLLVMHGDEFDSVVRYAKFLALLGDRAYSAALIVQPLVQRAAPPAGLSLLVAVGLAEAPGEGGGEGGRPVRERARRTRRAGAASTAWCAATSITPRCARCRACCISTTATGWKAAPRWSSIMTGGWN